MANNHGTCERRSTTLTACSIGDEYDDADDD